MRKKILFLAIFLLFLPLLLTTAAVSAGPSAQLKQAETLTEAGQYQQVEQLYQQIVADNPRTDYAFQAQKGLAIVYVRWDKPAEAEAAFEQLRANYSNLPDFSGAVCVIGDNYRWKGIDEKARRMYQIAAEGISGSEAIWPKMGLAITSIRLKDYQTADQLTEQILTDFAGDDRLSTACCLIADAYRSTRHHRQAIDLYQYVIDNQGDSEYAMWSQMGIAISNIDLGNKDAAESAIEKLRGNYASHPSFYQAICDIADNYRWRDIYDKAHKMYQLAAKGISGSKAFWVKTGLAIASVHVGDYEGADRLTEEIRTEFADHVQLPEAICLIAGAHRSVGDYEKALGLYKLILEVWPRSEQALWTKTGMVRITIALGDEAAVQEAMDDMIADFKDYPALPAALWAVGDEYYYLAFRYEKQGLDAKAKEYFAKVISLGETVRQQLRPSTTAAEAWFFSAECYYRLAQYEKAIGYYEKVVQNWPEYEYAWLAQHRVVKMYKWLLRAAVMSDSEADAAMKIAYEQLLAKYPDCPGAKSARTWVDQYYRKNRGEQK
jgi:tetratricopeptide (TPR) repeat protein